MSGKQIVGIILIIAGFSRTHRPPMGMRPERNALGCIQALKNVLRKSLSRGGVFVLLIDITPAKKPVIKNINKEKQMKKFLVVTSLLSMLTISSYAASVQAGEYECNGTYSDNMIIRANLHLIKNGNMKAIRTDQSGKNQTPRTYYKIGKWEDFGDNTILVTNFFDTDNTIFKINGKNLEFDANFASRDREKLVLTCVKK